MVFTGCEHAEHTRTTVGKLPQRGGCLLGTGCGRWLCLRLRRYLFVTRATEARPCWEYSTKYICLMFYVRYIVKYATIDSNYGEAAKTY